jgi:phospholipid/cholesterol/gamma-HCH transport system substrate-binding protein
MAAPTNHTKLGLFVLLGIAAIIAVVVTIGARSMKKETVVYHTFFNESVQGLEVGSPVKFRGVTIGHVSGIEIAPDHRHVEVLEELDATDIRRMGLVEGDTKKARFLIPPDLRAQLGSQGITGVKFISIDFFDAKSNPPPPLSFPLPDHYIPAAPSMMKNLEDTITKAMDRLPELVDAVVAITGRVDRMVAQLEKDDVTGKAASTLGHADEVLTNLNATMKKLDKANIPEKASATIDDLHVAVGKMNKVLDRIDGDKGLLTSFIRASDAVGDVGKSANVTTRELEQTLKEIRDAAEAIRLLADSLEKDPDQLLKGRAKAKSR